MTIDELADLVVAHLNALESKPIVYQAIKPEDTAEADAERESWGVFVVPFEKSLEPFDRGGTCREEIRLSIVVNGPVKGAANRAKGEELADFLGDSFRDTDLEDYSWDGNEIVLPYDTEALKTKKQFLHVFRPKFFRFA